MSAGQSVGLALIGQARKDTYYTLLARVERLRIGRSNRPSYMETEINPVSETLCSLLVFLHTRRWANSTSQTVLSITTYLNTSSGDAEELGVSGFDF